jgi:hypothetical protein
VSPLFNPGATPSSAAVIDTIVGGLSAPQLPTIVAFAVESTEDSSAVFRRLGFTVSVSPPTRVSAGTELLVVVIVIKIVVKDDE